MALNKPTGYLQTLINAGADAMSNLYYLKFDFGPGTSTDIDDYKASIYLKVRNSDFSFDGFTQTVDKRHYMTTSISTPKPEITGQKSLTLRFRVDANYELYNMLMKLWSVTTVANFGFAGTDVPGPEDKGGITVTVYGFYGTFGKDGKIEHAAASGAKDGSSVWELNTPGYPLPGYFSPFYQFRYCYIQDLTGLTFSYGSVNPETLQVKLNFFEFKDFVMNPVAIS